MDRPAIVIRDIHHYGDDLTVPEAVARLRGGYPVTVTVTDPAPPGGDPRGNPRHGFGITVRPALGRQPELPPEISWEARSFETPDNAALFAGALALATRLAGLAGLGGGQAVPGQAAAVGAAHGRDAARRALARATPAACHDLTTRLEARDPMVYDLYATPALSGQHGIHYDSLDLAGDLGLSPADDGALAAAEDGYFTAAGEAFWAETERIARDRAAQHPHASTQRGVCKAAGARDRFRGGDRVALEHTGDPHTRLRPGDEGTVTGYDPGPGQLSVRWDSGSTLAMLLHDGDRVRLITPAPRAGLGDTGTEPGR
jgi:hypothetical protein